MGDGGCCDFGRFYVIVFLEIVIDVSCSCDVDEKEEGFVEFIGFGYDREWDEKSVVWWVIGVLGRVWSSDLVKWCGE